MKTLLLLAIVLSLAIVGAKADTISNYPPDASSIGSAYFNALTAYGQSFRNPLGEAPVKEIIFYLSRLGNPTGNAEVSIYETDTSNLETALPVGNPIAKSSNVIDIATIPTTRTGLIFAFSGQTSLSGTVYIAVVNLQPGAYDDSGAGNNIYIFGSGGSVIPGHAVSTDGTTWSPQTFDLFHNILGSSSPSLGTGFTPEPEPKPNISPPVSLGVLAIIGIAGYFLFFHRGRK